MFRKLIQTDDDISRFVLRLLLGIVMFPHAAQKVLGWYGGPGFQGTMTAFTQNMGIPAVFALLAILAESLDRNLVVSERSRKQTKVRGFIGLLRRRSQNSCLLLCRRAEWNGAIL